MKRNRGPFPAIQPTGVDRSITPNGTVRSEGGQLPSANGGQRGDLGTSPTAQPFLSRHKSPTNRTGEGGGGY